MGDNIYLGDRDSVRTPMQWSPDRNGGFSKADFAQLYLPPVMDPVYGVRRVNVEAQQRNPGSFLHWLRGMLVQRRAAARARRGRRWSVLDLPQPLGARLRPLRRGGRPGARAGGPPAGHRAEPTGSPLVVPTWETWEVGAPVVAAAGGCRCPTEVVARPALPRRCCACTTSAASPSRPSCTWPAGPAAPRSRCSGGCRSPPSPTSPTPSPSAPYGYLWFELSPGARPRGGRRVTAPCSTSTRGAPLPRCARLVARLAGPTRGDRLRPRSSCARSRCCWPGRPGVLDVLADVAGARPTWCSACTRRGPSRTPMRRRTRPVLGSLRRRAPARPSSSTRCATASWRPLVLEPS